MNIIRCFKPGCQNEADYYCECTSPKTYFCEIHLSNHCTSKTGPHNIDSLFLEPAKRTKKAVLGLLEEEISETFRMKAQILDSFNRILRRYEKVLKKLLNEIDYKLENASICYEKIHSAQRVSRFESDKILNLLLLQPNEVEKRFKAVVPTNLNNIMKLAYKMNNEISKILKSFKEDKSKANQDRAATKIYDDICLNELSYFRTYSKDFVSIDLNTFQISSTTTLPIIENIVDAKSCIIPDKTYFYCCNGNTSSGYTFTIDKDKNVKQLQNSKLNYGVDPIFYNNFIYLIGGSHKLAERYDFKRNIWESMAPITQNLDFSAGCNALYKDLILITSYCMQKIVIYNIPQNNYQEASNLVLNADILKLMLQGNNRIYVFEKPGRTFESAENNISSWTQIANNTITNNPNDSSAVLYKGSFYFVVWPSVLWKFDISSKQASRVAIV